MPQVLGIRHADDDHAFGFQNDAWFTGPQFFVPPTSGTASNGLPIYSWTQAAAQLTRTGTSWATGFGTAATISYAFRAAAPDDMPSDTAGFSRFSTT